MIINLSFNCCGGKIGRAADSKAVRTLLQLMSQDGNTNGSAEEITSILEEVKHNEVLWRINHPDYHSSVIHSPRGSDPLF